MKKKVTKVDAYYGAIDEIDENGSVYARLYEKKTNELYAYIEFPITNFLPSQRKDIIPNVVFQLRIGYIGNKIFNDFRIKYLAKPVHMTDEKAKEISQNMFNRILNYTDEPFTEA